MKRQSLLRRLIEKLKSGTSPDTKTAPTKRPAPRGKKRTESSFEPLDDRIAPATLVNATTVTFQDLDGDLVTVKFSKAIFTGTPSEALLTAQNLFHFKDANGVTTHITGNNNVGEQLQLMALDAIALSAATNPANGASITITATPQSGTGDGLTNVGHIRAASSGSLGISLTHVNIDGDLGQIDIGNPSGAVGLKSLTVQTLGAAGLSSQAAGGSLESAIIGALNKLTVKGNMVDASLQSVDGVNTSSRGKIGSIFIGGSLSVSTGNTVDDAGSIFSKGDIGSVKVGTIIGGDGDDSGRIAAGGKIKDVNIGTHILGGDGANSGEVDADKAIGKVKLGGSLWAGTGDDSGRIVSGGSIGAISMEAIHGEQTFASGMAGEGSATISADENIVSLKLSGSIGGGAGDASGFVRVGGTLGAIIIGGSLVGGAGDNSGHIDAGKIGGVTIEKTILGGAGDGAGSIVSDSSIGDIAVKNELNVAAAITAGLGASSAAITAGGGIGEVKIFGGIDASLNGTGENSASIQAGGGIASLQVQGSITGGDSTLSGSIAAGESIGGIQIVGSLLGGDGSASGSLLASGKISSVSISGGLVGGVGADSGSIVSGADPSISGDLGRTSIAGGLTGGDGLNSGSVRAGGKIVQLTLGVKSAASGAIVQGGDGGGSASIFGARGIGLVSIFGDVTGGEGANSASIFAEGGISSISIVGDLLGGSGEGSASIAAFDRITGTGISAGNLGTIAVSDIVGGNAAHSGRIFADGSLNKLTAASLTGSGGAGSASVLIGQGLSALDDDFSGIGGAISISIMGTVTAGVGADSARIEIGGSMKALSIGGDVTNSEIRIGRSLASLAISGAVSGTIVSAFGVSSPSATSDLAIGKVTIGDDVADSQFLAGYDRFGNPANGNAQIGNFSVGGDWTASSLVAGAVDVNGDGFGNADDTVFEGGTISKIASIVITGQVTGTGAVGDHFGFVAQVISKATIGGATVPLTAARDTIPLAGTPATNDTSLLEIP